MARYDAFVLRVWRGGTGDEGQWAGRVERLADGMMLRFGSLAGLLAYLGTELAVEPGTCMNDSPAATEKGVQGEQERDIAAAPHLDHSS